MFASGGGLQEPYGLAFGPDGNLYVADHGSNAVLRFDGTTGAFIDVFASGTNTNPTFILFNFPTHAPSSIIEVDTTADDLVTNGNCTLREAIRAANLDAPVDYCAAGSGFDFISVPAGTYHLTRAGANEDDGLTGDLDLRSGIALQGAGSDLTVIDASGLGDRVMHVMPPDEGPDISGNSTGGSAGGIGTLLSTGDRRQLMIEFTTISDNAAAQGGGIHLDPDSAPYTVTSLLGTIVAGNDAATNPDVDGAFASRGDNLIGDGGTSTGFTEPGDQVGTTAHPIDPRLGPLANNGGSTKTQALAAASPARDAADCLGMVEDQRHEPRPFGGACDIGAFELPEPGQGLLLGAGIALLGLLRGRDRR